MTIENRKKVQILIREKNYYEKLFPNSNNIAIRINGINIYFRRKDVIKVDNTHFMVWCDDIVNHTVFIALADIKEIGLKHVKVIF